MPSELQHLKTLQTTMGEMRLPVLALLVHQDIKVLVQQVLDSFAASR